MGISTSMHLLSDAQLTKAIEKAGIFSPYNLFAGEDELYPAQYFVVLEIEIIEESTNFVKNSHVDVRQWAQCIYKYFRNLSSISTSTPAETKNIRKHWQENWV